MIVVGAISSAYADVVSNNAQVYNAPNGVEVMDIATPNSDGVSYNSHSRFSVDQSGLVLNNSAGPAVSKLAGAIAGNPNGGGAKLIINEVIGGPRSELNGLIEVAGSGANVIIANEAGITCKGCGFINAPKATLTSAKVDLNSPDFGVNVGGSRDVVIGTNPFEIIVRTAEIVANGNDSVALDARALGAMSADKIYIVATNQGVGMNAPATNADDIVVTADGEVKIKAARARNSFKAEGNVVTVDDGVISAGDVELKGKQVQVTDSYIESARDVRLEGDAINIRSSTVYAEERVIANGKTLSNIMKSYTHTKDKLVSSTELKQVGEKGSKEGYSMNHTEIYEDEFSSDSDTSIIYGKKSVALDFEGIENHLSHIISDDEMNLYNSSVNNSGFELYRTIKEIKVPYVWEIVRRRHGTHRERWGYVAQPAIILPEKRELIDAVYSTISAGGKMSGANAASIVNGADNTKAYDAINRNQGVAKLQKLFSSDLLYKGGTTYVIETRPEYIDLSKYVSSDALYNHFGVSYLRIGDSFVENQIIKQQMLTQGLGILDISSLYDNAITFADETGKQLGEPLTEQEIASLKSDLIWLEWTEINGQTALTPKVYSNKMPGAKAARISAKEMDLSATKITNYGEISGNKVTLSGQDVVNAAKVTQSQYANGSNETVGIGGIISGKDVTINASQNAYNLASTISGENTLTINAGNEFYNSALSAENTYHGSTKNYSQNTSSVTHHGSTLQGGTVSITAKNAYNTGSKIIGDSGTITAQNFVSEHTIDVSHNDTKHTSKGTFSKRTKTTSEDSGKVNKSEISFANGYTVNANTTLTATDTSGVGIYNGNTVIKSATEYSASDASSHSKNPIRFKDTASGYYKTSVIEGNVDTGNVYNGALSHEIDKALSQQYAHKKGGFTKEFVTFAGVVTTVATAGAGAGIGAATAAYVGAESAAVSSAIASGTSAAFTGTTSAFAMNIARHDGRLGRAAHDTFGRDGLKGIAAGTLTAGITSGVSTHFGVVVDNKTLKPVSGTELMERAKYAGVQATVKTGIDTAVLGEHGTLLDNLRASAATQAHAATASAIGAEYRDQNLTYAEHNHASPQEGFDSAPSWLTNWGNVLSLDGKLNAEYSPINKGPLPDPVSSTFRGGHYREYTLTKDLEIFRVYGGKAMQYGAYWTTEKPKGPLQAKIDLALKNSWGNTAEKIATITLPAGTKIYHGFAESQGEFVIGGGEQIFLPKIEEKWKKYDRVELNK